MTDTTHFRSVVGSGHTMPVAAVTYADTGVPTVVAYGDFSPTSEQDDQLVGGIGAQRAVRRAFSGRFRP